MRIAPGFDLRLRAAETCLGPSTAFRQKCNDFPVFCKRSWRLVPRAAIWNYGSGAVTGQQLAASAQRRGGNVPLPFNLPCSTS